MNNWKFLVLSLPLAVACGDKEIEDDTNTTEASSEPSSEASSEPGAEPSVEEPDLIEAAAVGFELFTGWNQETGELVGWLLDDGSVQDPYVVITLASIEYFNGGYDASETCEMYASFTVDETADVLESEIFNWDAGAGSSGTAVAPWANASFQGYLEVFAYSTETNCDNFDPAIYPLGGYAETFNLMHFGISFADLGSSSHVNEIIQEWYDEDGDGTVAGDEEIAFLEDSTSYMTQYVAMNHPNSSADDGYDFIGYDWNYGAAFQFDAATGELPTEPCEDDPETECLIRANVQENAGTNQALIRSGSFWLEDFPNIDLEGLQLGNGIPDSNE